MTTMIPMIIWHAHSNDGMCNVAEVHCINVSLCFNFCCFSFSSLSVVNARNSECFLCAIDIHFHSFVRQKEKNENHVCCACMRRWYVWALDFSFFCFPPHFYWEALGLRAYLSSLSSFNIMCGSLKKNVVGFFSTYFSWFPFVTDLAICSVVFIFEWFLTCWNASILIALLLVLRL